MSEGAHPHPGGEALPSLADVIDTPLDVLLFSDDSALDHSVRRILTEIDGEGENYAGHGASPD